MARSSKDAIEDLSNNCFLSIASLWELVIKLQIGKLELEYGFEDVDNFLIENKIRILPIELAHVQKLPILPFYHKDPFDRIIISQAITENLTLVTRDKMFKEYKIALFW